MNVVSVLFKPLHNGHFLLSRRSPLWRGSSVKKKKNTDTDTHSATDLIGLLLLAVCLARGGGGTRLCKLYRYVQPHRVAFLSRFGLKTGIHFVHFGLESGMVFEGNTGVYEPIYRFDSK